jgi:lipoprotein-anchoring transpeptidase ErfK/SrfK
MRKAVFAFVGSMALTAHGPCQAQAWPPWADDIFGDRGFGDRGVVQSPRWREPAAGANARGDGADSGDVRDGGPRPEIAAKAPPVVAFPHDFPATSIVIDTGARKLYFVLGDSRAYAYPISVGREGFGWTGTEPISRKQAWPDWYPPKEMRERDSNLPEKMTGGIKNPLGAMALYLGKTLYRIHGTNDVKSIGRAQSSGCFRMLNSAVLHLASLAEIGTSVTVVDSLNALVSHANDAGADLEPRAPPAAPPAISDRAESPQPMRDYRALRDYALGARP